MATHLSADRLASLAQLCANWEGPISAAVFVAESEVPGLEAWCREDTVCGCGGIRTTLTAVLHDGLSARWPSLYPVNTLRNVAISAVETESVLVLDADFVVGGAPR